MHNTHLKLSIALLTSIFVSPTFAAEPVDLSKQNIQFMRAFIPGKSMTLGPSGKSSDYGLKEIKQGSDFKKTLHIRVKETYLGYKVHGGDAVIHIPQAGNAKKPLASLITTANNQETVTGMFYQGLEKDLANTPNFVFNPAQAEKAFAHAVTEYKDKTHSHSQILKKNSELIVYLDDANKAHWAFHVKFYMNQNGPSYPNYIIDAATLETYDTWNDVKRIELENVKGGGFGGNPNLTKLIYDGLPGHFPALDIKRDPVEKKCYLANDEVTVNEYISESSILLTQFPCEKPDENHNNLYWNADRHAVNGAYSPDNDALFAGKIVVNLYRDWYGIPVLTKNRQPMLLEMVMHSPNIDKETGESDPENAQWDPETQKMYFGDGGYDFYPLVSIGVAAHEVSHGFTEHHSDLIYSRQSGGMNEAFSDIAAMAAEFYFYGEPSWQIGAEIAKDRRSIRYFEDPKINPRHMSTVEDYKNYVWAHMYDRPETRHPDPHHSSGIYNHAFYVMATSPEWGNKKEAFRKAFDVIVLANQFYWNPMSTFQSGACDVVTATKNYGYDLKPVERAFTGAGIDVSYCP